MGIRYLHHNTEVHCKHRAYMYACISLHTYKKQRPISSFIVYLYRFYFIFYFWNVNVNLIRDCNLFFKFDIHSIPSIPIDVPQMEVKYEVIIRTL